MIGVKRITPSNPVASSTYGAYTIDKAFDGDLATYWRSAVIATDQWVSVEFEEPLKIVLLNPYLHSANRPKDYILEASSNGLDWTAITTGQFQNVTGWQEISVYDDTKYQYWRLFLSTSWGTGFAFCEIDFYYEFNDSDTYQYTTGIKIDFDKEIVTDVEKITGSVDDVPRNPYRPIASSEYSATTVKYKAFDGSILTYWRGVSEAGPEWLGADLGAALNVNKCRVYIGASYRPKTFVLEGSADMITWTAVTSGTLSAATGWQDINFSGATYRYWRLYFTASYTTYFAVYEMEFYGTETLYDANGFSVMGNQYDTSPEGEAELHEFTIRKLTKTTDNMSVIIWLSLDDRIKYPAGQLTVDYNQGIGNLEGAMNSQVESFSKTFTPTNFIPLFDPSPAERIDANIVQSLDLIRIYYSYFQDPEEAIEVTISQSAEIIRVDDIID